MIFRYAILFLTLAPLGFADYTLQDGKLVERETVATLSDQEHYSGMIDAFESLDWKRLIREAQIISRNFSSTPYARDVAYYLGVAYFHMGDYELANVEFTDYLTRQATPKFFDSAIQYKFEIAEGFRTGKKKHFLGLQALPKWTPAGSDAISIYDEVISAYPHHELAAYSLFGKAQILSKREDFRASIEAYQTLIRRFPKHPLSIESYIGIGEVYLSQAEAEYPDPDFLDLAELNLRKFKTSFPGEEKLEIAEGNFIRMQDYYASCFFDTAKFYERTKKWGAAKIYYQKILATYPNSEIATKSKARLENIQAKIDRIEAKRAK